MVLGLLLYNHIDRLDYVEWLKASDHYRFVMVTRNKVVRPHAVTMLT
jgi:hypothetical protein